MSDAAGLLGCCSSTSRTAPFRPAATPIPSASRRIARRVWCEGARTSSAFSSPRSRARPGPCDATAAVGALRAAAREDLQACRDIDATLEAMKPVKEFREGSRQMGRQTLRVAAALTGEARLARYAADVDKGLAPGHHAVAYGWPPRRWAGSPSGRRRRISTRPRRSWSARRSGSCPWARWKGSACCGASTRSSSAWRGRPRRATRATSGASRPGSRSRASGTPRSR